MDSRRKSEYRESSTITFEWTLRDLRNIFDSTTGDKKSKVIKSALFGNNRWQILFYPNVGQVNEDTDGKYISLFLSSEPTQEEKEAALGASEEWVRKGVYKFSFEIKGLTTPAITYNAKEAHDHSFTWKTANWGWAQYARRDTVFYNAMPVKSEDAFLIICNITSAPVKLPIPSDPEPTLTESISTVGS